MRLIIIFLMFLFIVSCAEKEINFDSWEHYLGDPQRTHYSTLSEISADNLGDLEVAWRYNSPDTGQMQMNSIIIDGVLYGISAGLRVFALDAKTGEQKWIYGDPKKVRLSTSRGVSYWAKGSDKRILFTKGKYLIALNAETGQLIESFGEDGMIDLHLGLPKIAQDKFIISNTPGAIYGDLIILPIRVSEGPNAAPGDIRAFNIVTGELAWTFHVIPYPGEEGYETWENKEAYKNTEGIGAGNNWSGITVDVDEGILYVPTGSFAPDFYGGNRPGTNLYANCLLALNADDGSLIWHQQLTHHDIWDRDLPAPPNLLKIRKEGRLLDAVAQVTKQGYVYVFDKKTGRPIYPLKEIEVPSSNLEKSWPTQPVPDLPKPFARFSSEITEENVSPYAPNKEELQKIIRDSKREYYSPPDTINTILLPGYDGGAEWGGAGVDPENGIIYINSNEMAWMLRMERDETAVSKSLGSYLYKTACSSCHMADLSGNDNSGYPSLVALGERRTQAEIIDIIKNGKGMMPGFTTWSDDDVKAVTQFVLGIEEESVEVNVAEESIYKPPYKHTGYRKFLDANGLPALDPPWGTLSAIDLNSGEFLWKQNFGEIDSLMQLGYPLTGSENYGGPIITQNGLLIIAATKDGKARIYDRNNGKLLWEDRLPAASFATPSTYMLDDKQYIVFVCGGQKLNTKPGNSLIAYALKNK